MNRENKFIIYLIILRGNIFMKQSEVKWSGVKWCEVKEDYPTITIDIRIEIEKKNNSWKCCIKNRRSYES